MHHGVRKGLLGAVRLSIWRAEGSVKSGVYVAKAAAFIIVIPNAPGVSILVFDGHLPVKTIQHVLEQKRQAGSIRAPRVYLLHVGACERDGNCLRKFCGGLQSCG